MIEKAQEIPFRIYIEDEDAPVFIGNIALDKVGEDEFNFLILEEDFEKKLVTPVIGKASGVAGLNTGIYIVNLEVLNLG